jgi:two-component system sensor histidine kinase/response regulator
MKSVTNVRVLVVEDDTAIRATLVDMLEFNGCEVIQASNGPAGLDLARRRRPDIILTDIAMPGFDGFEFITALRAADETRATPVIILSASVEPETMRKGMDLGAEDYLVKPFTEDQVLSSIHARLEKKALLDELDAFAHTVAHDLKNPIAILMMRTEVLQTMWTKWDDAAKLKQVAELAANAGRLNNIVDELLILAGVGRQTVQTKPVDMAATVQEALGRIDNLLQKSGAQLERPNHWPVALGHAPWVVEIWANYLSNAVKYGGQPPLVRLGADVLPDTKRVRFWVDDNGTGLTPEQQAQLFKAFSRVTETRVKGHGLGLSIVRRISEKLDGQAGVTSEVGKGSRFWFELPQAQGAS